MQLLVATGNKNKLEEFGRILAPLGIEILAPEDLNVVFDVEETGETFAENARIKAEALYRLTGVPTVADDSGLCIDALGGAPGVYSARYRGEDTPYDIKMSALLEELAEVPDERRGAYFACAIHCVLDDRRSVALQENCAGIIAHAPSGRGGFGYDPLFFVGNTSFADLNPEEKDAISHRGKALRAFAARLREELAGTPQIRKAHRDDLNEIMQIIADTIAIMKSEGNPQWGEDYPIRRDFAMDIENGELYVCQMEGRVAGVLCLNQTEPEEYAPLSWTRSGTAVVIHRMAVATWCRRQGVGSALMRFAEKIAGQNGMGYLKTDTYGANRGMNALFQKHGFVFTGNIQFKGRSGQFNCYEKIL